MLLGTKKLINDNGLLLNEKEWLVTRTVAISISNDSGHLVVCFQYEILGFQLDSFSLIQI